MAKYTNAELVEFIKDTPDLDNDAKSQLIKLLRESRSYGIVWEDNPEDAVEFMKDNIPYFVEDKSKEVLSANQDSPSHVLIEGDNVNALATLVCSTNLMKISFKPGSISSNPKIGTLF